MPPLSPGNTYVVNSLMSMVLAPISHILDTTSSFDAGLSDVNTLRASLQATSVMDAHASVVSDVRIRSWQLSSELIPADNWMPKKDHGDSRLQ